MTWPLRPKRVFVIDIETCPSCGGVVQIIARAVRQRQHVIPGNPKPFAGAFPHLVAEEFHSSFGLLGIWRTCKKPGNRPMGDGRACGTMEIDPQ